MATRIYSALGARQQRQQTLVSSWGEAQRTLQLCGAEGRPCNLLLGANVTADSTLTLPSGLPSFSLDGGGKYNILIKGTYARWCTAATTTVITDVGIVLLSGASVQQLFGVGVAGLSLSLSRVRVDARQGDLVDVFGLLDTFAAGLLVDSCEFRAALNLFADDGGFPRRWDRCVVRDTTFLSNIDYSPYTTLGRGAGSVAFRMCEFARINSALRLDLGVGSHQCVFTSIPAFAGVTTNSTGVLGHTFLACSYAGTKSLGGSDVWLGDGEIAGPDVSLSVEGLLVSGATTVADLAATRVRVGDGSAALPSLGFASSAGNGAYISAANDWRLACGGTDNVRLTANGTTIYTDFGVGGDATFSGLVQLNKNVLATKFMSLGVQALFASGANYTITPTSSFISVTFSSATGSLKIATTGIPTGTLLLLRVSTVTSTSATLPDSTSNGVYLASAWTPTANSTLMLVFSGTYWNEVSRSNN